MSKLHGHIAPHVWARTIFQPERSSCPARRGTTMSIRHIIATSADNPTMRKSAQCEWRLSWSKDNVRSVAVCLQHLRQQNFVQWQ